jgi:hypothetical protein
MDKAIPPYRLVVFDAIDDPRGVRDLVCRMTGAHPTDAMRWIARAPGTWPKPLPEAQARAVLDGLYDFGIAAEAWRADQFPDLSRPRIIHKASCLPAGFRAQGLHGEATHWAPWDKIDLISAGRVDAEDEFRSVSPMSWPSAVVAGLRALTFRHPAGFAARHARVQRVPRDPVGEVLIVRRDPLIAFRVVENQMNYSYLGNRLTPSAAGNFPVFLADLCARADRAFLTDPTRALLGHDEPGDVIFPSSQALWDYSTHRLLWSWYRHDRDAGRAAEP